MADELTNEPDDAAEDTRRMDEEIRLLAGILRTLARLEPAARSRVITYLSSRFVTAG